MHHTAYTRVEEHLSSEGVFLLGDAQVQGFPICFASPGFEALYGYHSSDIVGRKCGDLIGGPFILNDAASLRALSAEAGVGLSEVGARVAFLVGKAGDSCRVMMTNPGRRVGVSLLVNRKASGELFVCECLVLCLRHPSGAFTYCVGFQRDITSAVSLRQLCAAASSDEEYSILLKSRSASLESRRMVLLGVGSENVINYLHEKAEAVLGQPRPAQVPSMSHGTFMHVQDHLSTEGVFLMGDVREIGFPIRYASMGFEDLYGYRNTDIVGRKCGDVIGGSYILANADCIAALAASVRLPPDEVAARVRFITGKAGEACEVMMRHQNERVGVSLVVNRKKGGELFVCECIVLCLQHPSKEDLSYTVGFQRDITREVPLRALVGAAGSEDEYAALLASRAGALEARRAVLLGVGCDSVIQYLHQKAEDVFCQEEPPMPEKVYAQVEEHLSSEGIFLMGDSQQQGFPIRYASRGFEDLYGYTAHDIVGKKCGDLIGGPFINSNMDVLASLAASVRLPIKEAESRIGFLSSKAGEACRLMMNNPGKRVGVALLVNRKKNGELFVCECLVLCLRHPTVDWSYTVGFQRDITADVPLRGLLAAAASEADYQKLIRLRTNALERRRAVLLGVGSVNVVRYLHEKALDVFSHEVWRAIRSDFLGSNGKGKAKATGTSSKSTTTGGPTASTASARAPAPTAAAGHRGGAPTLTRASPPASAATHRPAAQAPPPTTQVLARRRASPLLGGFPRPGFNFNPEAGLNFGDGAGYVGGDGGVFGGLGGLNGMAFNGMDDMRIFETNEVVQFLAGANLLRYAEPLIVNGFEDMPTLLDIQDEDMKDIGLKRGHMVMLRKAVRQYKCLQICEANAQDCDDLDTDEVAPLTEDRLADRELQESWRQVQALGVQRFAKVFAQEFFRLLPEVEELFRPEVSEKYWTWSKSLPTSVDPETLYTPLFAKIITSIGVAACHHRDSTRVAQSLVRLGGRHAAYGAKEEHFPVFGEAFVAALRRLLPGDACGPETERAWTGLFERVAACMSEGLRAVQGTAAAADGDDLSARDGEEHHTDEAQSQEVHGVPEAAPAQNGLPEAAPSLATKLGAYPVAPTAGIAADHTGPPTLLQQTMFVRRQQVGGIPVPGVQQVMKQ